MKIALLIHGQPRFTPAFQILMAQLQGWDQADLYFVLWRSDWAQDAEEAQAKIQPILAPGYNIKEIIITDQPDRPLPNPKFSHPTDEKESVRWWYKRRVGMWLSLKMAFDLVDPNENYDLILKVRGDGRLDRSINLASVDIAPYKMLYPCWPRNGYPGGEICDQFLIADYEGMSFYADMINHIDEYIVEVYPEWESDVHRWASEHMLNHHMVKNGRTQHCADFRHMLKNDGRADCDDKDLHLQIGKNPTK